MMLDLIVEAKVNKIREPVAADIAGGHDLLFQKRKLHVFCELRHTLVVGSKHIADIEADAHGNQKYEENGFCRAKKQKRQHVPNKKKIPKTAISPSN